MNLKDAVPGDIVNFKYIQPLEGCEKRHLARVEMVRKLSQTEIDYLCRKSDYRDNDPAFKRTETLVTCKLPGGKIRNFYAERSEDCSKPAMAEVMYTIKDMVARVTKW